jgi:pimeloyl-ACP methyl ester carboxylesterase
MPKLFLISGLGADERLFKNLDLSGFEIIPVTWIEAEKKDTLTTYATKLINQFGITAGSSVIGVSLGGMLTVEVAKQVQLQHAIIISSIKSKSEQPWYFRFFRNVPVHKLISGEFLQRVGPLARPLFARITGSKETPMFFSMLKNSNPRFLEWAMGAALHWNGEPAPGKVHHLIGTADLIFYEKLIKDAIVIPKGDHMMVFARAKEISPIIQNILNG